MSGIPEQQSVDPQAVVLCLRVLGGDLGAAHLWFNQSVLDRYRDMTGWRVMRTNTVGRVRSAEGWSLDFGIAGGDGLLHTSARELSERLPAAERQHWAQHVVVPQPAATFSPCALRRVPASTMVSCAIGPQQSAHRGHKSCTCRRTGGDIGIRCWEVLSIHEW